jgi:hypothetical protein
MNHNNKIRQHSQLPARGGGSNIDVFVDEKNPPPKTTTQKPEKKKCTTDTCTASSASAEKERVAAGTRGAKADDRARISLPRVRNRSIATEFIY